MSLQMYDVEVEGVEVEDFVQPDCDADQLVQILEADFVQIAEFEEDGSEVSPLRRFGDCPPLAFAGIVCATLSFVGVVLFTGFAAMVLLRSTGLV